MTFLNSKKINYLQRIQFLKDLLGAKRLATDTGLFETFQNLVVQSNLDGQRLISLCRSIAVAAEQPEFILTKDILLSHSSQASSIQPLVRDSLSSSSSGSSADALNEVSVRIRRQIDSLGSSTRARRGVLYKIFAGHSAYRCAPQAEVECFTLALENVVSRCIASQTQTILLEKLLTKNFGWVKFVKFLEALSKEPDLSASTLNQKFEECKKTKAKERPKGELDQLQKALRNKLRVLGFGSRQARNKFSKAEIFRVAGTSDEEKLIAIFKRPDEQLGKLMAAIGDNEALKDELKNTFQKAGFGIGRIILFLDAIDLEAPITISSLQQAAAIAQSSQAFSKEELSTDESEYESDEASEKEDSDSEASRKRGREPSEDDDSGAEPLPKRSRGEGASTAYSANPFRLMSSPPNLKLSADSNNEEFGSQYWPKTP